MINPDHYSNEDLFYSFRKNDRNMRTYRKFNKLYKNLEPMRNEKF